MAARARVFKFVCLELTAARVRLRDKLEDIWDNWSNHCHCNVNVAGSDAGQGGAASRRCRNRPARRTAGMTIGTAFSGTGEAFNCELEVAAAFGGREPLPLPEVIGGTVDCRFRLHGGTVRFSSQATVLWNRRWVGSGLLEDCGAQS